MDSCLAEKIFAFAPIFDPREKNRASQEAVYARHRERIINGINRGSKSRLQFSVRRDHL